MKNDQYAAQRVEALTYLAEVGPLSPSHWKEMALITASAKAIYDLYEPVVTIFHGLHSENIIKYIPLRLFSEDFRKMWDAELIAKAYMENGEVVAISIHKTVVYPKICNHQRSRT